MGRRVVIFTEGLVFRDNTLINGLNMDCRLVIRSTDFLIGSVFADVPAEVSGTLLSQVIQPAFATSSGVSQRPSLSYIYNPPIGSGGYIFNTIVFSIGTTLIAAEEYFVDGTETTPELQTFIEDFPRSSVLRMQSGRGIYIE